MNTPRDNPPSAQSDPQAIYETLPVVYACSGCSSAAQLANDVAVRMDRGRLAEMSCIAGVGGDILHLVSIARSGRPIIALDGCALHCAALRRKNGSGSGTNSSCPRLHG
jgi:uncharacterized metal-binding protein